MGILILAAISAGLCLLLTRATRRLLWPAVAATLTGGMCFDGYFCLLFGAAFLGPFRIALALPFVYAGVGAAIPAFWIALARWGNREEERSQEILADDDQRRKRMRRFLMFGAGAVLLILVAGDVVFRIVLHGRVQKELAAIRAEGFPVTLEELNAWYPEPPAGQNAADVYQKAFTLYADEKGKYENLPFLYSDKLPSFGEPLPPEMKAMMAAYVAENREALKLLHQAAAMPLCRFPVDFTRAFQLPAPRLGILGWMGSDLAAYDTGLRNGVYRLLTAEALVNGDDRRATEAAEAVAAMMGAGRSLGNEPLMESQGMSAMLTTSGMYCLQRVLSRTALSEDDLRPIDDLIKSAVILDGMTRAIAAARCIGSAAFTDRKAGAALAQMIDEYNLRYVQAHTAEPMGNIGGIPARAFYGTIPPIFWRLRFLGLLDAEHMGYLQFVKGTLREWQERSSNGGLFQAHGSLLESPFSGNPLQEACSGFGRFFISNWPLYDSNYTMLICQTRLAGAGIAVERYRNKHGGLPEKLSDLIPKYLPSVPLDPWDGKPVRYKRLAKGYVVYSVDSNGKGDGENADTGMDFHGTTFRVAR